MKTSHVKKKKSSLSKKHTPAKSESHHPIEKMNTDVKNWSSSISHRFLADYAIPFTRLVEAKLVSLQAKV